MAPMNTNTVEVIEMMSIFKDDRNYRTDEIAEVLRVDRSSVYRWIRDIPDPLPAFRTKENGQLRCAGRDLNEYLLKHKVRPEYE
ncbi:MAG: helix-turn-helix domain-containing protein [Candidatus Cloacimonadaceae bacterium]|nr:helix-turn-helix domain-containing protein [Candidatus Cloacimonadaceae bacterium]